MNKEHHLIFEKRIRKKTFGRMQTKRRTETKKMEAEQEKSEIIKKMHFLMHLFIIFIKVTNYIYVSTRPYLIILIYTLRPLI